MQQKYSLHIGINRYDSRVYGNANLQQCVRDAHSMYDHAVRLGFKPFLMVDEKCTIQFVTGMLRNLAKTMQMGDVLWITHSGHGTYTDTPKGRATGLCLYDGVLWDFEQLPIWKQFASQTTIVRMADTCYSQSNFRLPIRMAHARERSVVLPKAPEIIPTSGTMRQVQARMISYSSSNVQQPSYENNMGGVFTQAVEEILKLGTPTYAQLLTGIKRTITQWDYPQTPKLETSKAGDFKNRPIFT